MDLTSLGLHITDRCNAKCVHCAFGCGPEIRGSMGLKEAKQHAMDAKELGTQILCITGGEPMLFPHLVEEIIAECRRLSFPEIWLFTNGFWAYDMSRARAIVGKLRTLGLTKIFTSIDFFHQSYVPIKSVKNAIEASLEFNIEASIDARFIGEPSEDNKFNSATRFYLESLGNLLPKVEVIKALPMFVGRAAKSFTKNIKVRPLSEILTESCPGTWAGGTLKSPLGVDVDESEFVTICPGLSIGNAHEVSVRKIVEGYDYRDFAIIAALHDDGMEGLMDLASKNGFTPKNAYISECHFCYETRKFLRRLYPEAFAFIG